MMMNLKRWKTDYLPEINDNPQYLQVSFKILLYKCNIKSSSSSSNDSVSNTVKNYYFSANVSVKLSKIPFLVFAGNFLK